MKIYRETVINNILKSPNELEVKTIIEKTLQKLKLNGTHPFIILRFTARMTADLMDANSKSLNLQENNNVSKALNELESYEIKNTTKEKLEKH